ncbi:DUF2442 domain-containing protein [Sulfuricystis multivorans]|uniref:DUF2442 domain-containing protein n=1 Tax=Sulfuricystis multivorans TaxID=2211108 RepID=UPI000F842AEF|nr:DUF2442 domain-containing protein [Sulfuricystis multivorans]
MIISPAEFAVSNAQRVTVTDDTLIVEPEDGRTVSAPLGWFPRLCHATEEERANWRLIGPGLGIHWEDIDEDISIESLLLGKGSGESQASFQRWLKARTANKEQTGN